MSKSRWLETQRASRPCIRRMRRKCRRISRRSKDARPSSSTTERAFANVKFPRFSLNHLESRAVGDNGYDVGTYRQTFVPAGGAGVDETGKVHRHPETIGRQLENRVRDLQQRSALARRGAVGSRAPLVASRSAESDDVNVRGQRGTMEKAAESFSTTQLSPSCISASRSSRCSSEPARSNSSRARSPWFSCCT